MLWNVIKSHSRIRTKLYIIKLSEHKHNTLRPRPNDRYFADDIFKCIFLNENVEFRLKFHWSAFLRVQLTTCHHWLRWWHGDVLAPGHYLNQWWEVYWPIYTSPSLNECMKSRFSIIYISRSVFNKFCYTNNFYVKESCLNQVFNDERVYDIFNIQWTVNQGGSQIKRDIPEVWKNKDDVCWIS